MIRIRTIKDTLGQVFHSPEASGTWGDDITVNMDGGVGGSWKVNDKVNNYVDDVLSGKNNICKRESPLSE